MNAYIPHLIELRKRILLCVSILFLVFLIFFYFDATLYAFLASPLLRHLPKEGALVSTEVTSTFTVPMKLAFVCSLFLTSPYLFYQVWRFVAPGLYRQEKKSIFPILLCSLLLFYLGVAFSYVLVCPMALHFFANCAPEGLVVLTDIRHHLDFVLSLLLAGGLAFQVPMVTIALIKMRIISVEHLIYLRPYVIVLVFIVGMLLTPPDVVSQVLLALPMWGLFELGLLYCKYSVNHSTK